MNQLGIDALVVCKTSRQFLNLTAKQFFSWLVQDRLQAKAMIEGPNFFFGRDRRGNVEVLAELCDQANIKLQIVEPMHVGPQMISSTRIRGLLAEGAVAEATDLLGHPHRISGTVTSGAQRGREIGFSDGQPVGYRGRSSLPRGLCRTSSHQPRRPCGGNTCWPQPDI